MTKMGRLAKPDSYRGVTMQAIYIWTSLWDQGIQEVALDELLGNHNGIK